MSLDTFRLVVDQPGLYRRREETPMNGHIITGTNHLAVCARYTAVEAYCGVAQNGLPAGHTVVFDPMLANCEACKTEKKQLIAHLTNLATGKVNRVDSPWQEHDSHGRSWAAKTEGLNSWWYTVSEIEVAE